MKNPGTFQNLFSDRQLAQVAWVTKDIEAIQTREKKLGFKFGGIDPSIGRYHNPNFPKDLYIFGVTFMLNQEK